MSALDEKPLTRLGMGLDFHAEVFRSGNKVIRAIRPQYEQFYRELVAHPVTQELVKENLMIPVAVSSTRVDGFNLVLEHPLLPHVTYPFEWTPSMFRDASKLLLKLNIRLAAHGFCTQDGHPWNVLFDGTTPKFIDFTSIVKMGDSGRWQGVEEFEVCCISALKLMAKGFPTVARRLLLEVRGFPDYALANAVMFNPTRHSNRGWTGDLIKFGEVVGFFSSKIINRVQNAVRGSNGSGSVADMQEMLDRIDRMNLRPSQEMWSDYYVGGAKHLPVYTGQKNQIDAMRSATPKHEAVSGLLSRLKPRTLLDIACNRGVYSQMAALQGAKVIGIDNNESVLDEMYGDSRSMGTYAIPLYVNISTPAEAIGFSQSPFPTVPERLKSECVLCLALVHHLVFKQPHLHFDHIAKLLASYTEKNLIVEFVPREDSAVQESLQKRSAEFRTRFDWYSLENFKSALNQHFRIADVLRSFPDPRVILVCERKNSNG